MYPTSAVIWATAEKRETAMELCATMGTVQLSNKGAYPVQILRTGGFLHQHERLYCHFEPKTLILLFPCDNKSAALQGIMLAQLKCVGK